MRLQLNIKPSSAAFLSLLIGGVVSAGERTILAITSSNQLLQNGSNASFIPSSSKWRNASGTTEITVPGDFLYVYSDDTTPQVPKLQMNALKGGLNEEEEEEGRKKTTTEGPKLIFLWILLSLIIMTPFILQPIFWLFSRFTSGGSEPNLSGEEAEEAALNMTMIEKLKPLKHRILLQPTLPDQDPFLCQPHQHMDPDMVHHDRISEAPQYCLMPGVSLRNTANGQLFHLPTGLAFVPVHQFTFNPLTQRNVDIFTNIESQSLPGQVYNVKNKKLYERFLAVGYNATTKTFFLPAQPNGGNIGRLAPEEVHEKYRDFYLQLLKDGPSAQNQQEKEQGQEEMAQDGAQLLASPVKEESIYQDAM